MDQRFQNAFIKETNATNGFLKNLADIDAAGFKALSSGLTDLIDLIDVSFEVIEERLVEGSMSALQPSNLITSELSTQTEILRNIEYLLEETQKERNAPVKSSFTQFAEDLSSTSDGLSGTGEGLLNLVNGLTKMGVVLTLFPKKAADGMYDTAVSISKTISVFAAIKDIKNISDINTTLSTFGKNLLMFGGVLTLAAPLYILAAPGAAIASLVIVGFSQVMTFVNWDAMSEGALTLTTTGIGIAAFGLSLWAISKMEFDMQQISMTALAIIGFGGAMWLMSKFGLGNILQGSVATAAIGLSVWGFAYAFNEASNLIGDSWGDMLNRVGILSSSIAGIGLAITLAGLSLPLILPGVAAIGLFSGSLFILGKSLKSVQDLTLDENIGARTGNMITSIFNSFSNIGLKDMLKATLAVAPMISLGVGLSGLAVGVERFAELDKKGIDFNSVSTNVRDILITTKDVFAEIGGSDDSKTSLMGFVFGDDLGTTPVQRGIASVRDLGNVLTTLADGVGKWADLRKNFPTLDFNLIGENVRSVLTATSSIFEEIGNTDDGNTSMIGVLFGNDLGTTPVQRGIASVRDLGMVLNSLADGVGKWANLEENFPNLNYDIISNNIRTVLQITSGIFSELGNDENASKSIMSFFLGTDFGSTPVERGIAMVRDLGGVLNSLADGIMKWASLDNMKDKDGNVIKFDREAIMTNIRSVLTVLPDLFSDIGAEGGSYWFQLSTDMEQGIELTQRLSESLNMISDSLIKYNDVKNPLEILDKTAESYERISKAIQAMPEAKLDKFNNVLFNHHKILTVQNPENDALLKLVDAIRDLLMLNPVQNTGNEPTLIENKVNTQVTQKDANKAQINNTELVQMLKTSIDELKMLLGNETSPIITALKRIVNVLKTETINVKPTRNI